MSSEQGVYFHTSHRCAKFVAQAPKYNTWLKCKSSTQCYKPGKSITKAWGSKMSELLQCDELLSGARCSQPVTYLRKNVFI